MPVLAVLHVPADVPSLRVVVNPAQTCTAPVIANGKGFIVTTAVTVHPVPREYVTTAVPADTPITEPNDVKGTLAIVVGEMLHVPPPAPSPSRVVPPPAHACRLPVIAVGTVFTVIVVVVVQPVGNV